MLVPSPRDVPSYDFEPEMSAAGVADRGRRTAPRGYAFCVVNFANPGHGRSYGRDPGGDRRRRGGRRRLGRVVEATTALGGVCLVTADHGNAEKMLEADGVSPHTAHTTNPVPLVLTEPGVELRSGGEPRRPRADSPETARTSHSRGNDGQSLVVNPDNGNR